MQIKINNIIAKIVFHSFLKCPFEFAFVRLKRVNVKIEKVKICLNINLVKSKYIHFPNIHLQIFARLEYDFILTLEMRK